MTDLGPAYADWERLGVFTSGAAGAVREDLARAWLVNRGRDADERRSGFAAVPDCPPDEQLRTVVTALVAALAGFRRADGRPAADGVTCLAEACAMVMDLEAQIRGRGR